MTGPFERWRSLGFQRLLPVIPPSSPLPNAGKRPGVLNGDGGWHGRGVPDFDNPSLDEIRAWDAMGAGVGLRTGGEQRIGGFDVDTKSPEWSATIHDVCKRLLPPTWVRIGNAPKLLLIFRLPEGVGYTRIRFNDGTEQGGLVELLAGDGKFFVIEGIHPVTGLPYTWPNGVPRCADIPELTKEQLETLFAELRKVLPASDLKVDSSPVDRASINQDALKGNLEAVKSAVLALPNTRALFPDYRDMVRVGEAIHAATMDDPGLGEDLFHDWYSRWEGDDYKPDTASAYWRSFKAPHAIGADWLYEQAEQNGWAGKAEVVGEKFFEPISDEAPLFPENFPKPFKDKSLVLTPFAEAAATALSAGGRPLVKGLLDQGGLSALYGFRGSGKTFVTMDIAIHVAMGKPWAGMRTTKAGVVYVAAEGGVGARRRAAALRAKYGAELDGAPFHYVLSSVDLLRPDADLQPLIAAIRAASDSGAVVGLVVIDTLSRALAGGDENTSTDMGAVVKHLDALRAATGAHVLVVHHSGKDRARGARGHSLLSAALDTEIEIEDSQIIVTKQREMDDTFSTAFSLDVVTLGIDADGDPITSCTVRLEKGVAALPAGVPTPREQDILTAFAALADTHPNGVSLAQVVEFSLTAWPDLSEKAIRRLLDKLSAKRLISRLGSRKWVSTPVGANSPSIFD